MTETERGGVGKQRDRQRDRGRETERERKRDREAETEAERQRETQRQRHRDRETETETEADRAEQAGVWRKVASDKCSSLGENVVVVEVLLYVHRNRRLIRDGSPGRPPRLSHGS